MKRIEIGKWTKKMAAGVLAAALIVSGVVVMPKSVEAATGNTDTIQYVDRTSEFKTMWKEDGTGTAPVMTGYVFGGWYVDEGGVKKALSTAEAIAKLAENPESGMLAKFVPAYVLGVKAQNLSETTAETESTSTRIISSVDSKNYQAVGAEIWLNNKTKLDVAETTKVYSGLKVGDETESRKPEQIFGQESHYLSVWRLTDIAKVNYSKIIYVRPYWVTMDGTKVFGLAKYVHVEDGYNGYVSVPINLMTGEAVAAGALKLTCNDDRFEFYDVQTGRIFDEMEKNASTTDTVKIVGNAAVAGQSVNADGIYASARFKLKSGQSYTGGTGDFVTFSVADENFCDWNEDFVTIDAWDIQY